MNLILFIHQDASKKGDLLIKAINQNFCEYKIQNLHTFNSFKSRLKQASNYFNEVFILFVDSKRRLNKLAGLIDLLESKRTIIILPDETKATVSTALQFFPRYFTYMTDSYADLCEVIAKMTNEKR